MNIIGIDLGLTAGISCYSENEGKIIDFKNISKPKDNSMPYSLYFKKELDAFCKEHSPCIIVVEDLLPAMHSSSHACQKLSVLADTVVVYCYENNIKKLGYTIQNIRKYFCDKSNARKDKVFPAMREKGIDLPTTQHDIVDSIAVIYYHLHLKSNRNV